MSLSTGISFPIGEMISRQSALVSVLILVATHLFSNQSQAAALSFDNAKVHQSRDDLKGSSSVNFHSATFKLREKPVFRESWISKNSIKTATYTFEYDFDELILQDTAQTGNFQLPTTVILLIHPIGIGIAKWYYDRLFEALHDAKDVLLEKRRSHRYIFVAPDLLASGSACRPWILTSGNEKKEPKVIPLLSIEDWSGQLLDLMNLIESQIFESEGSKSDLVDYCIVANGGCASIALDMAYQMVSTNITSVSISRLPLGKLKTVVLSAPPRVSGLLYRESPNVDKLHRTYNWFLLGLPGRIFWWYALRNEGQFLQKFTEKNLVASAENLSPDWKMKCFETAKRFGQKSKYSAFAFLAGALQRNCMPYLEALKEKSLQVHVIAPEDSRPNDAKSWLWQKRKNMVSGTAPTEKGRVGADVARFLQDQRLGGREIRVRGRRCLAHEDATGYAKALVEFLE